MLTLPLAAATVRSVFVFYGYFFPFPEVDGAINAQTEDINVVEFLWDFGPQSGYLGLV
jgi:hypothetical protein